MPATRPTSRGRHRSRTSSGSAGSARRAEGWKTAGAYKDSAISGDSMILRPGIQALLEDARRGLFEVLVAEALDRVSRD